MKKMFCQEENDLDNTPRYKGSCCVEHSAVCESSTEHHYMHTSIYAIQVCYYYPIVIIQVKLLNALYAAKLQGVKQPPVVSVFAVKQSAFKSFT